MAEKKSAKKTAQKSAKSASKGFTEDERSAMRERARAIVKASSPELSSRLWQRSARS
ncbi:MAG TPA: hypothetical protein VK636_18965 [Gemmatimonadaceae bacterium]|nr:hypothetical protein [Gemmatimonadaceae bacterium]